jgi:hypothetical protein
MPNQNKEDITPMSSGIEPSPYGDAGGVNSGSMAGKASKTVKESGARIADEARQYAGDMANLAKEKSRSAFQHQKEAAVGQVDSVAHALRSTADRMQGEGQAQAGRYIGMAADHLESFGSRLREKDLDTLIDDTQNLARRAPGAFFAGTVVAGFLLARFLKSSSDRRQGSIGMSANRPYSSPSPDNGSSVMTPNVYGSTDRGISDASGAGGRNIEENLGINAGYRGTSSSFDPARGQTSNGTSAPSAGQSGTGGSSHGN